MTSSIVKISLASLFALASIALNTSNSQIKTTSVIISESKKEVKRDLIVKKIKIDTLLSKIDTIDKSLRETKKTLIATGHMQDNILTAIKDLKDSNVIISKQKVIFDTVVIQKVVEKEIEKEVVKRDSVIVIKEVKKNFFQRLFNFLPSKKK